MFFGGGLEYYFKYFRTGISDSGWELIMAFIYLISFRSIMMVRIVNALVSAWMVVLIYKIARRNFGEDAARISAIMAVLLPQFFYYSGLHVKETMMVFLLMAFMERADHLLHSRRFTFTNIIVVVLLGVSLFFFRTVLAAAAWFALFSAFVHSSQKMMSQYHRIVIIIWLLIATFLFFQEKSQMKYPDIWELENRTRKIAMNISPPEKSQ
jgi:4-amino-4-deoxy-L-arabinose transferase-like glycosyltransferase